MFTWFVPSAFITNRSKTPGSASRSLANTIFVPVYDHAGCVSLALLLVTCWGPEPSAFEVQISGCRPGSCWKTTLAPDGDHDGYVSSWSRLVMRVWLLPS